MRKFPETWARCHPPRATLHLCFLIATICSVIALSACICGAAAYQQTFTTSADFTAGLLDGVNCTDVADQLQLNQSATTFPVAWIANSGEGTVSRIDTANGVELARYRTGPQPGGTCSPSRTSVDVDGNCWVGNRGTGTVIKILVDGGVDRNGNGVIDTSTGPGDIKPWWQDERVVLSVSPGNSSNSLPRALAIDKDGNIWVGLFNENRYVVLNKNTGAVIGSVGLPHGPYGAAIDKDGILWSAVVGWGLDKVDTITRTYVANWYLGGGYGIAVDRDGFVWEGAYGNQGVYRFNSATNTSQWLSSANASAGRGVCVAANGHIWVALGYGSPNHHVAKYDKNGNLLAVYDNVGWNPCGVGTDFDGNILVVCQDSNAVYKLNEQTGALMWQLGVGLTPYTYSDFTGFANRNIVQQTGSWLKTLDSGSSGMTWGRASWNSLESAGTSVGVEVRAAATEDDLPLQNWVTASNDVDFGPIVGRYLQIRTRLTTTVNQSPILYDLTVRGTEQACDTNVLAVGPDDDSLYVKPGEIINIAVSQKGIEPNGSAGFQAFLSFDRSKMSFVSGSYTDTPYPQHMISPIVPSGAGGNYLDMSTGIPLGGNLSHEDAVLANLQFRANADVLCATTMAVQFRAHQPESQFSDFGGPLPTCLVSDRMVVIDGVKPALGPCPGNVGPLANDQGKCSAVVQLPEVTASDDCSDIDRIDITRSDALPLTDPYAVGVTTITCIAWDKAGNSSDPCSFIVTVEDKENPTIECPADVTATNDAGLCSASQVTLGTPQTSDNCGVQSVTNDAPAVFPVGDTTVTWWVTDIHGNSATDTQKVTVNDTEKPTMTYPADVTVSNDPGLCSASQVALGTPTTNDNCGVQSVTNDAPAVFPVGETTVTWTVTDIHGNTKTGTQKVTVNDTEKPTIACPPDVTVSNDPRLCSASNVSLGTPQTNDNCLVQSVTSDAPAVFPVGETTVTWTVTDVHGNTATCAQKVTVKDTEKPVGVQGVLNSCYKTAEAAKADALAKTTWTDNCTQTLSPTAACQVDGCAATVTVTACDAAGNCESVVYNTRVDGVLPVISCPADIVVNAQCGQCGAIVNLPAVSATDNCDGVVAAAANPSSGFFPIGTTPVTYTATDSCGNSASCAMTVTVKPFVVGTFTVELENVQVESMTRCITFTFGGSGGAVPPVAIKKLITFVNRVGTVTIDTIPACLDLTQVTAKDERHSLRRRLALNCNNGQYAANFTGASKLLNGDLSNDNLVDIVDFGILAGQFGSNNIPAPDCSFPGHHADITGDQKVMTADFTFIFARYLQFGDSEVGRSNAAGSPPPLDSVTVKELQTDGVKHAKEADLNGDGIVNITDVKLFISTYIKPQR